MQARTLMLNTKLIGVASVALLACAAGVTGCGNLSRLTGNTNSAPDLTGAKSNVTVSVPYTAAPTVVQPGTMVTWVNGDEAAHSATSNDGVFDSKTLKPGQSYSYVFNKPGKYAYHSTVRGEEKMASTIVVNSAPMPYPSDTMNPDPYPTSPYLPNPSWPDGDNEQQQEKHKPKPKPTKPTPRPTLYNPGGGGSGY
jgi:plastocyanin